MRARRLLPLLALVALLLGACGGAASPNGMGEVGIGGEQVAPGFDTGAVTQVDGKDQGFAPLPYPGTAGDGSALIVNASIGIAVDDLDAAIAAAKARVRAVDGVLTGFSRGGGGYPIYAADGTAMAAGDGPATLLFRVPADRLEALLDELRTLGEVTDERSDAADVSASLRDLGARLKNLRAAEANYVRLLDEAASVSDLLAVQAQLDSTRGQIEQLAAEEAALKDAVARSSLSLTLYPPASPVAEAADAFDPSAIFDSALADLLRLGQGFAGAVIYLAVFALPLALVALLVALLFRRRLAARWDRRRERD